MKFGIKIIKFNPQKKYGFMIMMMMMMTTTTHNDQNNDFDDEKGYQIYIFLKVK